MAWCVTVALTMKQAKQDPRWARAYAQAAIELQMPARGARGSAENRRRETLAPHVAVRARQILDRGELQEVTDGQTR